jgi:multiple sugar transport system permease protein
MSRQDQPRTAAEPAIASPVARPMGSPRLGQAAAYAILVALVLFALGPFTWVLLAAFDPDANIFVQVPRTVSLENFQNAFTDAGGLGLIVNSLIYAGGATLILVVVTTLGGYALSRYDFPGRRTFMLSLLVVRVIPPTATIVPLFLLSKDLGFVDTYHGVILVLASLNVPFGLWIMKGYFDTVPIDIEEAAWVDGANRLQTAFRIVLPLAGPGVAAAALIGFIGAWGEFLIPLVLVSDPDKMPISIGLFRAWLNYTNVDWGLLAALSIIYMVPAVVFYVVARRALQSSLAGGMAGQ